MLNMALNTPVSAVKQLETGMVLHFSADSKCNTDITFDWL